MKQGPEKLVKVNYVVGAVFVRAVRGHGPAARRPGRHVLVPLFRMKEILQRTGDVAVHFDSWAHGCATFSGYTRACRHARM